MVFAEAEDKGNKYDQRRVGTVGKITVKHRILQ
jgi:hypothetical protein